MQKEILKEPMFIEEIAEDQGTTEAFTGRQDLRESTSESMKKRLPWLVALLFLGMGISSVVSRFESVVATLPLVVSFQSLILDMAGNSGTQSLVVTIRVLMDEETSRKDRFALVVKELKVGFTNGLLLGVLAAICVGGYVFIFKGSSLTISFLMAGAVGLSLLLAMMISSLVGTLVPLFFQKVRIDPAVASGPLITTMNDLVAVITYYGLAGLMLRWVLG